MSQLSDIQSAQKTLEECFMKRMDEMEAQIQSSGPAKDTVAKLADEFRAFRELVFKMLGILRSQIQECTRMCDNLETRNRRKALIFSGVPESNEENCTNLIVEILHKKLGLNNITSDTIKTSHRLGKIVEDRHRPILVRFCSLEHRAAVWRAKTGLKGSLISIKEFLTRARQSAFTKARLHFGMRACWTQDGVIVVRTPDGHRCKVVSVDDLNPLLLKYPKMLGGVASSAGSGTGSLSATSSTGIGSRKY